MNFVQKVYDFLSNLAKAFYEGIISWLEWMLQGIFLFACSIYWTILSIAKWCFQELQAFINLVCDFIYGENGIIWVIFDWAIWMGNWFVERLPDLSVLLLQYRGTFSLVMSRISAFNAFLPIVETCILIGIFLLFLSLFLVCKLVLKLLPMIG
ncbi:MAG: hypothetical protein LBH00_10565 [Planctomycetaceae bacterium]|jgi:hypothetical protein|nr:hypothetical protein [Planctomycetaceae bacterium]